MKKSRVLEKFIKTRGEMTGLTHRGKLVIKREKDNEWGYLEVDKKLYESRRKEQLIIEDFWKKPEYDPHISAFTKEEVKKLPENFGGEGKEIQFKLSDRLRVVDPDDWDEVYECAFEPVECYELERLRMSLGFTPLMNTNHEFHLTLGLKYKKDQK